MGKGGLGNMMKQVQQMQTKMAEIQAELENAWQHRDAGLPYEMPYQALIAASLIEKETGRPEDRTKIAQVFVSRLQIGMRLQADPSVIYGIGAEISVS